MNISIIRTMVYDYDILEYYLNLIFIVDCYQMWTNNSINLRLCILDLPIAIYQRAITNVNDRGHSYCNL